MGLRRNAPYARIIETARKMLDKRAAELKKKYNTDDWKKIPADENRESLAKVEKEVKALFAAVPPLPITVDPSCQELISDVSVSAPEGPFLCKIPLTFTARTEFTDKTRSFICIPCDRDGNPLENSVVYFFGFARRGQVVRGMSFDVADTVLGKTHSYRIKSKARESYAPSQPVTLDDKESAETTAIAFSCYGERIATGGAEGIVRVWDAQRCKVLSRIIAHKGRVNGIGFVDTEVFSAGEDGAVCLWEIGQKQPIQRWTNHSGPIMGVAVSSYGSRAVTGGKDKKLCFWNLAERRLIRTLPQDDQVLCVALSDDGKRALSGGRDGVVRVWDCDSGKALGHFDEHKSSVVAVAISPDGQMAASSFATDTHLPVWDVETKKVLRFYDYLPKVTGLAVSHDGTHLLIRNEEGGVLVSCRFHATR